ncbi:MAG: imidazole glycerol phosphate synthase subunit HisF [Candidatus Omnitrophica bacterium]|nr:imidazole glycerol phosphate synthase subunit HisF [Candidatus Omnitrophota bacterium]
MAKNRLIFTLLMQEGTYMLSRNFSLQSVGGLDWIKEFYNFDAITFSIDELIVLNVERGVRKIDEFSKNLAELNKGCFMPLAVGGGIRTMEHAYSLLNAGADKLIINTPLIEEPKFVSSLVKTFGSQCIIASIDYRVKKDGDNTVCIRNGSHPTGKGVDEVVKIARNLGCGEIYLTSIDKDGTGEGLDLELIRQVTSTATVPVIASGGVGKFGHFTEGLLQGKAEAVSTANLFNFIEDGLIEARSDMQKEGIKMASWNFSFYSTVPEKVGYSKKRSQ